MTRQKGLPLSEKSKRKMSITLKNMFSNGRTIWNKGKEYSPEFREKMREIIKNTPNWGMRGKHHSEETRKKMREVHLKIKNDHWKGKHHTKETIEKIRLANKGKNSYNWLKTDKITTNQ